MNKEKLTDLNIYNARMAKSTPDKLFFMGMIENIDTVLDYGCADGNLIYAMNLIRPQLNYCGYDIAFDMVELAELPNGQSNIFFSTKLDFLLNKLKAENTVLNLSSIIHEIYSYCGAEEINEFWNFVFNSGFRYIAIRDMMVDASVNRTARATDIKRFKDVFPQKHIDDFESYFGSITENKNFLHLLLKYKYLENWKREVKENYLPLYLEELLGLIPADKYEIHYFDHYILPYTKQQVKEDLDIDLKDKTHLKMLLSRKDSD